MQNRLNIKVILSALIFVMFLSDMCYAVADIGWSGKLEVGVSYQESPPPQSRETSLDGNLNVKMELNSDEKQRGVVLLNYKYRSRNQEESQDAGSFGIYQAYLDLFLTEHSILRAGRQKISWGSGFAWNPTNYIGADKNRADLTALNPGVDVINYEVALNNSSGMLALKPQDRWGEWGWAVKFGKQVCHSDFALSIYQQGIANAFGIDYATVIGNFTVYTEVASKTGEQFFIDNNLTELTRLNSERYLHGVIGVNGYLSNNWMLILEYYYNQEGWNDQEAANFNSKFQVSTPEQQRVLSSKKAGLFGEIRRNYLEMMIRKGEVIDDLALSINAIRNLDDQSYLLIPRLEYQIGRNTLFEINLNYFGGGNDSEFGTMSNQIIAKFVLSF